MHQVSTLPLGYNASLKYNGFRRSEHEIQVWVWESQCGWGALCFCERIIKSRALYQHPSDVSDQHMT